MVPKRCKNFTVSEDECLVSAYLNISKDPIIGTNQPIKGYWQRITEYFHEHKSTPYDRSQSSLQQRWGDIQKETSRFCGFYVEVERRKQSGLNVDDKVKKEVHFKLFEHYNSLCTNICLFCVRADKRGHGDARAYSWHTVQVYALLVNFTSRDEMECIA